MKKNKKETYLKALMKKIKDFIFTNYLLLVGTIIFTAYFWSRYLREHTSKTLPINLTVMYFFILVYICGIFTYILISLMSARGTNDALTKIIDWIFIPLKELEQFIRCRVIGSHNFEFFLTIIKPVLNYIIIKTNIFYILFWVFPRLILLTALFVDIFIFHQFHYKYQVILFGLFLLFNRYFKYTLKNLKEEKIKELTTYVKGVLVKYKPYIHPSELEPDYDPEEDDNDDWPPTMDLPLEIYINYNTKTIIEEQTPIKRRNVFFTQKAWTEFWELYLKENYVNYFANGIPLDYKNIFGDKAPENYNQAFNFIIKTMDDFFENKIEKIMTISLLIEHLNITSNTNTGIKRLKILIYLNYLICWLYVLIISLPSLDILAVIDALISTYENIKEPF